MASDNQGQKVVQFLANLQPGKLGPELFHAFARLTVMPIYEVVPVRHNADSGIEILVLERPASDPVWGGLLHTPGTVIRADAQAGSFTSAQERIQKELGGVAFKQDPVFVNIHFHQVKRGRELALVHWVTLMDTPKIGKWVSANNLPPSLVDTQRDFIASAVQNFSQFG